MTHFKKQPVLVMLALAVFALHAWAQGGHLSCAHADSTTWVSYISSADQHIHVLFYSEKLGISPADIDASDAVRPLPAPVAPGAWISAVSEADLTTVGVHYISADQHVHAVQPFIDHVLLNVSINDVLDDTVGIGGVPKALVASALIDVVDGINDQMQTYYVAQDGNIHMLGTPPAPPAVRVRDLNLQSLAGGPAPAAGTALSGAADLANKVVAVFYLDGVQHVQKLAFDASFNFWNEDAVGSAVGAPNAAMGSPLTSLQADSITQTVYLGADQHVYDLLYTSLGGWNYKDLTKAGKAVVTAAKNSSLAAMRDDSTRFVDIFYVGSDQHLRVLFADTRGRWTDFDITGVSGSSPAAGSSLSATFDADNKLAKVCYVGTDQHVHEISSSKPDSWSDRDLTSLAGGQSAIP